MPAKSKAQRIAEAKAQAEAAQAEAQKPAQAEAAQDAQGTEAREAAQAEAKAQAEAAKAAQKPAQAEADNEAAQAEAAKAKAEAEARKAEAKAKAEARKIESAIAQAEKWCTEAASIYDALSNWHHESAKILLVHYDSTEDINTITEAYNEARKASEAAQAIIAQKPANVAEARAIKADVKSQLDIAREAQKAANKSRNALDRAIAREEKAEEKAREAEEKAQARINEQLAKIDQLTHALTQARAEIEAAQKPGTEAAAAYDDHGNLVVNINLPDSHANVLNIIAEAVKPAWDSTGQFYLKPANVELSKANKAIADKLSEQGYIVHSEQGYNFTEAGLALFGLTLSDVEAENIAQKPA